MTAGTFRFNKRLNYKCDYNEKNDTHYKGSHNFNPPVYYMDCFALRVRNDGYCKYHCEHIKAIYISLQLLAF